MEPIFFDLADSVDTRVENSRSMSPSNWLLSLPHSWSQVMGNDFRFAHPDLTVDTDIFGMPGNSNGFGHEYNNNSYFESDFGHRQTAGPNDWPNGEYLSRNDDSPEERFVKRRRDIAMFGLTGTSPPININITNVYEPLYDQLLEVPVYPWQRLSYEEEPEDDDDVNMDQEVRKFPRLRINPNLFEEVGHSDTSLEPIHSEQKTTKPQQPTEIGLAPKWEEISKPLDAKAVKEIENYPPEYWENLLKKLNKGCEKRCSLKRQRRESFSDSLRLVKKTKLCPNLLIPAFVLYPISNIPQASSPPRIPTPTLFYNALNFHGH